MARLSERVATRTCDDVSSGGGSSSGRWLMARREREREGFGERERRSGRCKFRGKMRERENVLLVLVGLVNNFLIMTILTSTQGLGLDKTKISRGIIVHHFRQHGVH